MKVLLFWSSGKDSAWALHRLRETGYSVAALLTTTTPMRRVPFHDVPVEWVRRQAVAAGLPLWEVPMPFPLSNPDYERYILSVLGQARQQGFSAVAFGDLYLEDIRAYREKLAQAAGMEALFPAWIGSPDKSLELAQEMLDSGIRAKVVWIDPQKLPGATPPIEYTLPWIESLPEGIDPCGERGEFHTFCYQAPCFSEPIALSGYG